MKALTWRAAATLAAAAVVAGCGPGLQDFPIGRSVSGPSYPLTIAFSDASGLPVGGRVELHDVPVGRIQSLSTHDFRAYVHVAISRRVQLPVGTTAKLALTTPLGEQYIELDTPPTGPGRNLAPGATIAEDATSRGADVEDLLAAFSAILNGGGVDQIHTIVTQLNAALHGHAHNARSLIAQVNAVVGKLADNTSTIDRTLSAMARLGRQLAAQRQLIARGLTQLSPGIAALHTDTPGFTKLVTHLSRLGRTARSVLGTVQSTLVADLKGLAPTLDTLSALRSRLGPVLVGLQRFALLLNRATPGDFLHLNGTLQSNQAAR